MGLLFFASPFMSILIINEFLDLIERHALGGLHMRVGFATNGILGLVGLFMDGCKLISSNIIMNNVAIFPYRVPNQNKSKIVNTFTNEFLYAFSYP